jgi:hypothetical protein
MQSLSSVIICKRFSERFHQVLWALITIYNFSSIILMHYCLARHTNTIGFSCNTTSICWHMFIFQICTNGFAAPNVSISTIVPTLHSTPFVSEITPNAYWHVKTLKARFKHRNTKQKHCYSYYVQREQRTALLLATPKHTSEGDIITRRHFILVLSVAVLICIWRVT